MTDCKFEPEQLVSFGELLALGFTPYGIEIILGDPDWIAVDETGNPFRMWLRERVARHDAELAAALPEAARRLGVDSAMAVAQLAARSVNFLPRAE